MNTSTGRHSDEYLGARGVPVWVLRRRLDPENHGPVARFFADTVYAISVLNQETNYAS